MVRLLNELVVHWEHTVVSPFLLTSHLPHFHLLVNFSASSITHLEKICPFQNANASLSRSGNMVLSQPIFDLVHTSKSPYLSVLRGSTLDSSL